MSIYVYTITTPDYQVNLPAVYRMNFGKKYFIWKGKALKASLDSNCKDIYRMWTSRVIKPGHAFASVINHVTRYRIPSCTVDVILQTEDPVALVAKERELLEQASKDPNSLNTSFEPYIPGWLSAGLNTAPVAKPEPVIEPVVQKPAEKAPVAPKNSSDRLHNLRSAFKKYKDAQEKDHDV